MIIATPEGRIHLTFVDLDLELHFDFLTVRDGLSPDAPSLGTFTGTRLAPGTRPGAVGLPGSLVSGPGGLLRLEFHSDHSVAGRGFNISYSSGSYVFLLFSFRADFVFLLLPVFHCCFFVCPLVVILFAHFW